jgi:thioredoxin-like negative regulator of GroEL
LPQSGIFSAGVNCVSPTEIEQHLTLGMQLLARGQYSDALSHFHAAIGEQWHALEKKAAIGLFTTQSDTY